VIATTLEEDLLGKVLDKALVSGISKLGSHPCGESGEYHTFVTAGPIFKKTLKVTRGRKERRDNVWFLEISAEAISER
jgi:diphthamide synthase (EF-2-diphthine--ammonia ligase)